jgi:hypothetical protein
MTKHVQWAGSDWSGGVRRSLRKVGPSPSSLHFRAAEPTRHITDASQFYLDAVLKGAHSDPTNPRELPSNLEPLSMAVSSSTWASDWDRNWTHASSLDWNKEMGWQQDNELVCVGCSVSVSLSEQVTLISLLATLEVCWAIVLFVTLILPILYQGRTWRFRPVNMPVFCGVFPRSLVGFY